MSRRTINGPQQNVGNKIGDIPSVKVHAPPGGSTSFSLAWGMESAAPEPARGIRRQDPNASSGFYGGAPSAAMPSYASAAPPAASAYGPYAGRVGQDISNIAYNGAPPAQQAPSSTSSAPGVTGVSCSSNAYASGANQNCGNFLTDRRTTKVHAPPGGRSSITFG